jgi:hypothetical protein
MKSGKFSKPEWAVCVIIVLGLALSLAIYIQRRPAAELQEAKEMMDQFHKCCVARALWGPGDFFESMDDLVKRKLIDQASVDRWSGLIEVEPRGLTQSDEGNIPLAWTRWRGKFVVVTISGSLEIMDGATLKERRDWQ